MFKICNMKITNSITDKQVWERDKMTAVIMCFAGSLSKTLGSRESTGALLLSFQAQEFAT